MGPPVTGGIGGRGLPVVKRTPVVLAVGLPPMVRRDFYNGRFRRMLVGGGRDPIRRRRPVPAVVLPHHLSDHFGQGGGPRRPAAAGIASGRSPGRRRAPGAAAGRTARQPALSARYARQGG